MRYLAALVVGLIGWTLTVTPVSAQNNNSIGDRVVYTLELTDSKIEDLKNGIPLSSEIPDHLIGKIKEIKLRYVPEPADHTARNPYGSSTSPIAPRTTPDFNRGGTSTTDGTVPRFRPGGSPGGNTGGATGGNGSGTTVPRFNPGSSSNDSWRNDNNNGLIPPTPRGRISQAADSPLGPPLPNSYDSWRSSDRRSTSPNFDQPSDFRPGRTQPASTQPAGNYFPPERERTDRQMRPAAPSANEFDTARRQRPTSDPSWRNGADADNYARQQPPQQRYQGQQTYAPPQTYQPQQTYNRQPPANRIASRDTQNNYVQPTRPNFDYPTDAELANRSSYAPPADQYQNRGLTGRGSMVAGHDTPMIPNHAPRIAASYGSASWNGAQGTGENLTLKIPANQSSPDENESVGVNRGPNGQLPVSQLNKFNNFLYFLLLCSIGLNIYLAWISRGFYVRYRELADELRDTFSSAV